ncbi:MAG: ATP synthase F1 subunit delta [Magnetococcales bacterium]|nr:ATP synthase F1 subunit delta [Magnetococcales bacterium]
MLNLALAKRYATALVALANERNQLGVVGEDLSRFVELLTATPALRLMLTSPTVPTLEKHAAVDAFIQHARPTETAGHLLKLLVDKRRMALVEAIIVAYHEEMEARGGRMTVEVRSPSPLDATHAEALRTTLGKITGKEIRLENSTQPDLLGGIVVRIGSLMMDYSVRNHLNRLKAQMRG